ncbi:MAG: hypothetical protein IJI27_09420 [Oscillospiraceae bacterium]|nr:hypothetical protein [Oscillospiraceae bacterium]
MATRKRQISRRGIIWLVSLGILAVLFVLSLILFRREAAEEGVIETSPYALDSSASQRFAVMDGGYLAVASGGGLQIFDENGSLVQREAVTMLQPALDASGDYAAACDVGGTTLVTMDRKGNVKTSELTGAIIAVAAAPDGWLAVVSEAQGYRGMVTVYDEKQNVVYEWYSGEDYVVNAALSGNHTLAVLCAGSGGAKVHIFTMDSEEEAGHFASDELMMDVFWTDDGKLAALSEKRLVFLDRQAVQTAEYAFGGLHLYDYTTGGEGLTTLALSAYRTGGTCTLVTLNPSGKVIGERTVDAVTSVAAHGKQILVRSGEVLTLYNQQLEDMRSLEIDPLGVRDARLLQSGRVLLIYDYSCAVQEI